jgi:copper chaperone CopZ
MIFGIFQKSLEFIPTFIPYKFSCNPLTLNLLKMSKKKKFPILILVISVLILVSCGGNASKAQIETLAQDPSQIEVSIEGMTCTGCELSIQNNVSKLEGIQTIKASFITGIATIEYLPGIVDTLKIKEAITGSGYKVKKFGSPQHKEVTE